MLVVGVLACTFQSDSHFHSKNLAKKKANWKTCGPTKSGNKIINHHGICYKVKPLPKLDVTKVPKSGERCHKCEWHLFSYLQGPYRCRCWVSDYSFSPFPIEIGPVVGFRMCRLYPLHLVVRLQFWKMWNHSFIAITPRFTLIWSGRNCYSSIYGSKKSV